jgi:hypothetical protein
MDRDKKKAAEGGDGAGWQYNADAGGGTPGTMAEAEDYGAEGSDDIVEWSASEFVAHEKGFGWYAVLAVVAVTISAGLYLLTQDRFSAAVVVIMAIILGVAGAHKPRVITYRLDGKGLTAGKKFYPYSSYKSFSMPDDGPFTGIVLVPLKRFGLPTGAYLAPESQDKALEVLSSHLPLERGEPGMIDHLMQQLRF